MVTLAQYTTVPAGNVVLEKLRLYTCSLFGVNSFDFLQRAQHKPSVQQQRSHQDPKKHTGDHASQRSSDLKRPLDGGGPGGKFPRMDRTYSGSSSHSGGRHSGSGDSYDPRRSSSFSHSDRAGSSSKDRSRDGYVSLFVVELHIKIHCPVVN